MLIARVHKRQFMDGHQLRSGAGKLAPGDYISNRKRVGFGASCAPDVAIKYCVGINKHFNPFG